MTKAALRFLTAVCCLFGVFCRSGSFFLGIMGFQPSFFLLHPPFFQIEAQCQEEQLHTDILLPGGQKAAEAKVIFQQSERPLHLDRTVRPQQDAPLAGDVLLGCFSLLPEGHLSDDLLRGIHILLPTALFPLWTIPAILAAVPCLGHRNALRQLCGNFSAEQLAALGADVAVLIFVVFHVLDPADLGAVLLRLLCFVVGGLDE